MISPASLIQKEIVKRGIQPTLGCAAALDGRGPSEFCFSGYAVRIPSRLRVKNHTIFDCASLTKPLITAQLVRTMGISPKEKLNFGRGWKPFRFDVPTIGQILSHQGGLPGWLPIYALDPDPSRALRLLPGLQNSPPGSATEYSCPGFILLGRWLELQTGRTLSALALKHLIRPLGLEVSAFFPLPRDVDRTRVAASEFGNRIERGMAGGKAPVRPCPIWGEVHDGNAHFLGGAAGNAGLFATVAGVMALARAAWLEPNEPLTQGTYWMGFKVGGGDSCFPEGTLGHTGFTGASFCFHLKNNRISVLLTNRLHRRTAQNIFALRKAFHAWAEKRRT